MKYPLDTNKIMEFSVLVWSTGKTPGSVFGVIDNARPGKLPSLSTRGHWSEFLTVREHRFAFATEAKAAIAADGYYLMGAGLTVKEAFGET